MWEEISNLPFFWDKRVHELKRNLLFHINTLFFSFSASFVCFRVRLVERGSPHSLPLMESGKVSLSVVAMTPVFIIIAPLPPPKNTRLMQ